MVMQNKTRVRTMLIGYIEPRNLFPRRSHKYTEIAVGALVNANATYVKHSADAATFRTRIMPLDSALVLSEFTQEHERRSCCEQRQDIFFTYLFLTRIFLREAFRCISN